MMKKKMKEMRKPYWHEESWNDFINKALPGLLGSLVPLSVYKVEKNGPYRMTVSCGTETKINYPDIPCPDGQGRFHLDGRFLTVVPELDKEDPRRIKCCGDLALDYIASRLGASPAGGLDSAEAFETWLPLNRLMGDFFHQKGQIIDERNWLAINTHMNRVKFDGTGLIWHESFTGRLDPVECPEGPNMGRVYTLAAGADVKEGQIIPNKGPARDDLGWASRMIPFLEHDDAARALMGANMMRQWVEPENGEKPLVITGLEPEGVPLLGFNLLTAYVSLGADTFEDGLVLSRSAAERMGYADPILPGDKFSNRHGQKGVVSAIWDDENMPRLPDGRPIDLAVSFIGLHTRLNFGQILEGAAGLSARHTGHAFRAEPFASPGPEGVASSPLPEFCNDEGMVKLTFPGGEGEAWSTAGYVYWGLTVHRGSSKLMGPADVSQRLGRMEYAALLEAGAFRTARDFATKTNGDELSFGRLKAALAQGEIELNLIEKGAQIRFAPVPAGAVNGAPLSAHPWSDTRGLYSIPKEGPLGFLGEKLASPDLFPALRSQMEERLDREVKDYFSSLLDPFMVSPGNRITRSARAVLAPDKGTRGVNELGVPRSLWDEFGLKEGEPILLNRVPTFRASSILALMPYSLEEPVLRMHPLLCYWLNADFDGDQAALYQPVGEEMREEVMQTLTPAAHLSRDPSLVSSLLPRQESLLGLHWLDKEDGTVLPGILGRELPRIGSLKDSLAVLFGEILREEGAEKLLSLAGQLFSLGLDCTACKGHSMSPLIGSAGEIRMKTDLTELIEGGTDEECQAFLPQRDAVLSGARGTCRQLGQLLGPIEKASLPEGKEFPVKGNRYSGLDDDAFHKMAAGMRQGLLVLSRDYGETSFRFMSEYNINTDYNPRGHAFLARAMRSENPGRVFAHAAANGEVDPLTDPWAAVFCGELPR